MKVINKTFTTKIVKSIAEINKDQWDSLIDDNVFISYAWLKTIEKTSENELQPIYILLYDGVSLVGTAACFITQKVVNSTSLDDWLFGRLKKYFNQLGFSFLPALICSPEKSYGSHVLVAKHLNTDQKRNVIQEILGEIEKEAFKRSLSIGFPNVINSDEEDLIYVLRKRGYSEAIGYPLNYFDIDWENFSEYQMYIRNQSKNAYKNIRKEINKNKRAEVKIKRINELGPFGELFFDLVNINYIKHNKYLFPHKVFFFELLKENFNDDCFFYTAEKNNQLVGVVSILKKKDRWFLAFVGVDHDLSGKDCTYFNICYYQPISDAISNNIKHLYHGNAMYQMKIRRGGKIKQTSIFYKPHFSFMTTPIKLWLAFHLFWMKKKLPDTPTD